MPSLVQDTGKLVIEVETGEPAFNRLQIRMIKSVKNNNDNKKIVVSETNILVRYLVTYRGSYVFKNTP